jgi:hypothetical protein
MTTITLSIGSLVLVARQSGPLLTVDVSSPTGLAGTLVMSIVDWASLEMETDLKVVLSREIERLRKERTAICSSMCGSNECRIRKQCTRVECTSLYCSLDYDAWCAALDNMSDYKTKADSYRAMLTEVLASAVPNERDHPAMSKAWKRATELLEKGSTGG